MQKFFLLLLVPFCLQSCKQGSTITIDGTTAAIENPASKTSKDDGLIWSEEFDEDSIDTLEWAFETGANGWGNNEWQNYTSGKNVAVSDGTLKIIAKKVGSGQKVGDYTSTRLVSKKRFKYGRVEIRAKIPDHTGNGLWPALWMLGEDIGKIGWPQCGEIDLMEYVSYNPNYVIQTIHSVANNHSDNTQISTGDVLLETIEEEFHNYGLIWREDRLDFYVDHPDNITLTINRPKDYNNDNWPFNKRYFFILNMAVGGNWGGKNGVDDTIFPAQMEVDYVRVYSLD